MSTAVAPDFLQIFGERRQCFADLLALSREQLQLIDAHDYTALLAVLGNKQRVIGRLEEISRTHPNLGELWLEHRDDLPPQAQRMCEEALEHSEAILGALLEHERVGTDCLVRRRDETQLELRGLAAGNRAQHAYRDTLAPTTHRVLDIGQ